jgi:hypothetical protein
MRYQFFGEAFALCTTVNIEIVPGQTAKDLEKS